MEKTRKSCDFCDIDINECSQKDLLQENAHEIIALADVTIQKFTESLESNDYCAMQLIAQECKGISDYILKMKLQKNNCCAEIMLTIVQLVFTRMHMYNDAVKVLQTIIECEEIDKTIRGRALDVILGPEPEFRRSIKNEYNRYTNMLNAFRNTI